MPLDQTFAALGDPTRRKILARLAAGEATVAEITADHALTQPAISKHLKVLENAGLIETGRKAQSRPRRISPDGLRQIDEWLAPFRNLWSGRFDRLDAFVTAPQSKDEIR